MLNPMNLQPLTRFAALVSLPAPRIGVGARALSGPFRRLNFLFQDPVNFVKFQPGFAPE